jgi:hypothetical protein
MYNVMLQELEIYALHGDAATCRNLLYAKHGTAFRSLLYDQHGAAHRSLLYAKLGAAYRS